MAFFLAEMGTEGARALSRSIPTRSRALLCSLSCECSDDWHMGVGVVPG
jgi:hypothetical protein